MRIATAADLAAMQEVEQCSPLAAHWSLDKYRALFAGSAPRRRAWVVEKADGSRSAAGREDAGTTRANLVGFLIAQMLPEQCEVENLVVREDWRRQGVASRLLLEAIAWARAGGARSVVLEVRQSNAAALLFYRKLGFTACGIRRDYYREPREDGAVYILSFDDLAP